MNKNMRKMYTEEEIVNLIKKANSDGNIVLGTKLYRHIIDFQNGQQVLITATRENPYTSENVIMIDVTYPWVINITAMDINGDAQELTFIELQMGETGTYDFAFNGTQVDIADGTDYDSNPSELSTLPL